MTVSLLDGANNVMSSETSVLLKGGASATFDMQVSTQVRTIRVAMGAQGHNEYDWCYLRNPTLTCDINTDSDSGRLLLTRPLHRGDLLEVSSSGGLPLTLKLGSGWNTPQNYLLEFAIAPAPPNDLLESAYEVHTCVSKTQPLRAGMECVDVEQTCGNDCTLRSLPDRTCATKRGQGHGVTTTTGTTTGGWYDGGRGTSCTNAC
jgi:hypothetical protein